MSNNENLLVAPDVLSRVLAQGRPTGADFSEVFVEDKRSTSAGLDDGKSSKYPAVATAAQAFEWSKVTPLALHTRAT